MALRLGLLITHCAEYNVVPAAASDFITTLPVALPGRIATATSLPSLQTAAAQPDCHLSLLPHDLLPAVSRLVSANALQTLALPAAPSVFDALLT